MIGHGLGAAGGLEAIATIKAINTGWVHPTINQDVLQRNLSPCVSLCNYNFSLPFLTEMNVNLYVGYGAFSDD